MARAQVLAGVVLCLFLVGCGGKQLKQRDYIESTYLTPAPKLPAKPEDQPELRRVIHADHYDLSAEPLLDWKLRLIAEDLAFQRKLGAKETDELFAQFLRLAGKSRCVHVSLAASSESAADLSKFFFTLESQGKLVSLEPILESSKPEAKTNIGSYSSGGYGYEIGNTYYYTPSSTHVYSYETFSSSNFLCAKQPIAFEKGFIVYVEPRYTRGIPVEDLVWSVSPADKDTFKYAEGVPYPTHNDRIQGWMAERRQQNQSKVSAPSR